MPKLIIQEGYRQTDEFQIPEGETWVGRNTDNDVVLTSKGVSRVHLRVACDDGAVMIADLGSRNGTFLNSFPVQEPTRLKHRDVIQLGDSMLVYEEADPDAEDPKIAGETQERIYNLGFLQRVASAVQENIERVVQGKRDVVQKVLLSLLSDGHCLIEDLPGVGKTMLARALAKSIKTDFKRIQFTPDMLPNDVTGVSMYQEETREFRFVPGPIFANVILADEINRGTPRTQSSLLECMSEAMVTVDGRAHVLQKPFFVIATQNPVDFHGTYPLPEAQLDRFLMRLQMGYPGGDVERGILGTQVANHPINSISYVVSNNDILQCQALVKTVHVSDPVKDYIVTLAEATRTHTAFAYGCSTRAALALMRVSQSLAAVNGREYVLPRDVRDLAPCVLSHRLPLTLQARAEWEAPEQVVEAVLNEHPVEEWERS